MKKKKLILSIGIPVVAAAAAATVIILVTSANTTSPSDGNQTAVAKQTIAAEDAQGEYVAETVDPSQNITMPGWASLTIAADTTEITSGVDFFNPEANEGYYDMTFELFVDVNGSGDYTSLYKSGLVYAGNHVQKITLSQPLSAGTYDAYVAIQPYKTGDQSVPLNNGNVQIELIVQ